MGEEFDWIFWKRVVCHQSDDRREQQCLVTAQTEVDARREVIHGEMSAGWRVAELRLVSQSP